jgi:hypothetical protein
MNTLTRFLSVNHPRLRGTYAKDRHHYRQTFLQRGPYVIGAQIANVLDDVRVYIAWLSNPQRELSRSCLIMGCKERLKAARALNQHPYARRLP